MKTFDNEWILDAFAGKTTLVTRAMFGGLAVYLHERLMLVLVEPTRSGRWHWHGVFVCTEREQHASIVGDFPALAPSPILRKWLYIDSRHEAFEATMEAVARRLGGNDPRFGVVPRSAGSPKRRTRTARRRPRDRD